MKFSMADNIKLVIPSGALKIVFDECDRYESEETGGRILGTYDDKSGLLTVHVNGIIEPGPNALRTASYFQQDGAYQERVFREVEGREPSIEHLGNWHTHHVNGLSHLSEGDIGTYRRIVEHRNHNTDFFYALLVTDKKRGKIGLQRYGFKNYILRRGDPGVYEVPSSALTVTERSLVWPMAPDVPDYRESGVRKDQDAIRQTRIYDRDLVSQFYPNLRIFKSKELGLYWRGFISLVDGSKLETVVIEDDSGALPQYRIVLRSPPETLARSTRAVADDGFVSCREALVTTERMCNTELYEHRAKNTRR